MPSAPIHSDDTIIMTTTQALAGSCLCGAVRYTAQLPTRFVSHCHCNNCRRAHGAGVVTYAGFPEAQVSFDTGEELLSSYVSDTGATRRFCSRCGSTILFFAPRWPGELHLVVANLEGTLDREPAGHVYADRSPAWCPITDDLPRFGGETGVEPLQ